MSRWHDDPEPIHLWFSLTYANYLVVPRSVLQSMPQEWQAKFCVLLDEMHEAFGHLDWPVYDVRALVREREVVLEYPTCERCDGDQTVKDGDGEDIDCPKCAGSGVNEDDELHADYRYETAEEVGFRTDPIPHYNRGRTKLTPRAPSEAARKAERKGGGA